MPVRTHGIGLPVESRHHQRRPTRALVRNVGVSSVTEQQGNAFHAVCESGGVKRGPASAVKRGEAEPRVGHLWASEANLNVAQNANFVRHFCAFHLPLESVESMMLAPRESINISATPSLSFILKRATHMVTCASDRVRHSCAQILVFAYTAQCNGLNVFPLIFLKTSCSNNNSTQASHPDEKKKKVKLKTLIIIIIIFFQLSVSG